MSRLIDADAIGLNDFEIIMCDGDYKEALKMLLGKIDAAPTIEERKTGKWKGTQNAECSQCGHLYPGFLLFQNYCPNCGARME